MELLAILGRGIQRLRADSDPADIKSWVLTQDLEVCGKDSAHLDVQVPEDDAHPFSMLGGGGLTMLAAAQLIARHAPPTVVCAYADRADYLVNIHGPTESEVMSALLPEFLAQEEVTTLPEVPVWPRGRALPGPSNTGVEVRCIFDLAAERGVANVGIVGTSIHLPRVGAHITKLFTRTPEYRRFGVQLFEAEEILLHADPARYAARVERMRNSESFKRMFAREAAGISRIVRDLYGDAKPVIAAA